MALNLHPERPVLLVMGGSQGASGINELVTAASGALASAVPGLQFLHLAGEAGCDGVRQVYDRARLRAVVRPFLSEMELAMAAATVAVSRAGAASLAELAAMRLPAVLVPYPAAADNHQYWNARALVDVGAARLLEQRASSPEDVAREVTALLVDAPVRERMRVALAAAQTPHAAERVAVRIAALIEGRGFRGLTFRAVERDESESEFEELEAGFGSGAAGPALGQRAARGALESTPVLSGGRA
jgi:UDP-N-acetylglucosamine--N-acetylmuramyl-(pentapeptide) pyrophosphoryl-undecaprenol N-acetylglucosamine transferase